MRTTSGLSGARMTGYDMGAALALGRAMGVSEAAVAEFLPIIENAAVRGVNEALSGG